jgi:hypothetical protein
MPGLLQLIGRIAHAPQMSVSTHVDGHPLEQGR